MKMVVGYIEPASFEPIRGELLALGFLSISAWDASGSLPEPTVTGSYRGVSVENHLRPKTRIECVVADEQVTTVIDTVLKHAPDHRFVFVIPVEQAFPTESVAADGTVGASTG